MRFIFNTPNNNELSDLADDGGSMIPVAPGGLPGQLHRENCMAIGTLPSPRAVLTVCPRTAFLDSPESSPAIFS